jgi:hypothetical protein
VNKLNSGIAFQLKCIAPSSRLANLPSCRQAFVLSENRFDDDLGNQFLNKIMPEFCKIWLAKFWHNVSTDVYINGCNDSSSVAYTFASHSIPIKMTSNYY